MTRYGSLEEVSAPRRAWLRAAVFAALAAAIALPLFAPWAAEMRSWTWWVGAVAMTLVFAVPVAVLLPLALLVSAWRRWRGAARVAALALAALYAAWAVPSSVRTARYIPESLEHADEVRVQTRAARRAMHLSPELAARRARAAGRTAFLATFGFGPVAQGVENDCLMGRYGLRGITGTSDVSMWPTHEAFQLRAALYARRYNAEMARLLGISPAERHRVRRCVTTGGVGFWPADAEIPR